MLLSKYCFGAIQTRTKQKAQLDEDMLSAAKGLKCVSLLGYKVFNPEKPADKPKIPKPAAGSSERNKREEKDAKYKEKKKEYMLKRREKKRLERIAEDAEKLAASSNNGGDEAGGTAQATTTPRFSFSGIGAQQASRDAHNESKKKARMRSKMNWNRNKDSPNVDACAYEVSKC